MAIFLSYGRTSPVSLSRTHDNRTPYAVADAGGGRSSAINRRMSAKRFRNGDLDHQECNVATGAVDLRADLDQLLLQAGQRPILTWEVRVKGRFSRVLVK